MVTLENGGCSKPLRYTKKELFTIKKSIRNSPLNRLEGSLWDTLQDLEIARKRTCRGGIGNSSRVKQIQVLVSSQRESVLHSTDQRADRKNLITPERVAESSSLPSKFMLWNARSLKAGGKSSAICDHVINYRNFANSHGER